MFPRLLPKSMPFGSSRGRQGVDIKRSPHDGGRGSCMYLSSFSILLLVLGADISSEARWPAFRGGPRAGVVEEKGLPATWSTTKNVVWKTEIPGKGWSSPIVWGERIFLTSVTREGKGEEAKKGLYFGGDRPKPP